MIPTTMNKDIKDERDKVQFSIDELRNWYHGGEDAVQRKRFLGKFCELETVLSIIMFTSHRALLFG